MRNTLSSARVASRSANPTTTNARIRSPVDRSPTPANALAATPPIPDFRASVRGSSSAALAPRPNTTTSMNT